MNNLAVHAHVFDLASNLLENDAFDPPPGILNQVIDPTEPTASRLC